MNKETLLEKVQEILTNNKLARDNDQILFKAVFKTYGIHTDMASYDYVCNLISRKELPSHESIRRVRQKLQESHPGLWGNKREKRMEASEHVSENVNTNFQSSLIF